MSSDINARALQMVGLTYKLSKEGKVSEEKLNHLNDITDGIEGDNEKLVAASSILEKKVVQTNREMATVKRRLSDALSQVVKLQKK